MKLRKKIFMGAMSIMLLLLTFTTTTYAWFKINSSAYVEGFEFRVTSGEGFMVSIDGEHFYRDLDIEQMKQAILLGYSPEKYELKEEKLVYSSSGLEVSQEDIHRNLSKISLLPRTSYNGIDLEDCYKASSKATEGSFVEFGVYFRTVSVKEDDKKCYDIYLAGEEIVLNDGMVIPPTSITSEASSVLLKTKMDTIHGSLNENETISVYAANAMRMSIQDTSLETPEATIYELTNESDLGSYATDYNGEDAELKKLYDSKTNAMFTYYNRLRPSAKLEAIAYTEKPQTIRSLVTEDLPKVTTVTSGSEPNLITFRIWLEGWDADCFDGLDKSIKVKLSFRSKQIIL